jgi:hypothetical protein
MTSRVLQEDSALLLSEANDPLINENYLGADSFVTGTPTLQTSSITQQHNITCTNLLTGQVVISTATIAQEHDLTADIIVTGSVVVSSVTITQEHNLSPNSFVSGSPVIGSSTIAQEYNLSSNSIVAGSVVVSSVIITQEHNLLSNNIVTLQPSVPSISIVEHEVVVAPSFITGIPVVQSSSIGQVHTLSPSSIQTSRPVVGTASDPDHIIIVEIEEAQRMFGGWARRAYEVPDGRLVQGEREVYSTYGQRVSIDAKAKSLLKFGKSGNLSTTAGLQTVWSVDGNETYISTNLIDSVVSSSASDTQEVTIEGHTIEGSGVDAKFTFVVQAVTLNGQTPVALTTPLARVSRVNNNSSTEIVGVVSVYEDSAVTGGVPNDVTKVHIDIPLGFQQSFKAATTFSNTDYFFLTGCYGAVSQKQTAAADFYIELREVGKSFRQIACLTASSTGGAFNIEFDPAIIIPRNADVRIRCTTGTNNAVVFTNFRGYLAKVVT